MLEKYCIQSPGGMKFPESWKATHCVDMLAGSEERKKISKGDKVLWFTPGWVLYRNLVFQDWDKAKANEHFPQHSGGVILLDGVNFWNSYSEEHPEEVLDYCDWMGIPIMTHAVSSRVICFTMIKIKSGG